MGSRVRRGLEIRRERSAGVNTPAFHTKVSTYTTVTIVNNENDGTMRIAWRPPINAAALSALSKALNH